MPDERDWRQLADVKHRFGQLVVFGVMLAVAAFTTESASAFNTTKILNPLDPKLGGTVLTHDHGDTYGLTVSDGSVTASAPATNTGGNTRVAFWRQADAPLANAESCATWTSETQDIDQQGAILRLRQVGTGWKAISVTKNVWYLAGWIFNVHVWDTRNAAAPFTLIGQFDLSSTFNPNGQLVPFPWSLCAETVGNTVSFIVWPSNQPQPSWGDPNYGGSVTLPAHYDKSGVGGWYVGHLQPGDSVNYSNLSIGPASSTAGVTPTAPTSINLAP